MQFHHRILSVAGTVLGVSSCLGSVVEVPASGTHPGTHGPVDAGTAQEAAPGSFAESPGTGGTPDAGSVELADGSSSEGSVTVILGVDASTVALGGVCSGAGSSVGSAGCGCTRRPAATNSFQCPAGVGESASAVVGPSGATLQLAGRMYMASGVDAQIVLPPTALSTPTTIVLTETAIAPPHDFLDWSPVYRIDPVGLTLAARAPVQFPWSNASGATPQGLALWSSPDGSCFTRVSDSYVNAGFQMGSTTQLGYFIVAVERTSSTATCP